MKTALVGCTGFVGGNLAQSHPFDGLYHSTDVQQAYGTRPELLVYAGMPAAKYLANTEPEKDRAAAETALENMRRIAPRKLVLISTVDVYQNPDGVNEDVQPDLDAPGAYGRNRAWLEQAVRSEFPTVLILRLPGLFGAGLKKNFLYDLLTVTPAMLTMEKYVQLSEVQPLVKRCYRNAGNGFYRVDAHGKDAAALREWFAGNDFNALSFTDSRAVYQFYDLSWLWRHISTALAQGLLCVNLATAPLEVSQLYAALTHGRRFENYLQGKPVRYDMHTKYAEALGGKGCYCADCQAVLDHIAGFMAAARRQL